MYAYRLEKDTHLWYPLYISKMHMNIVPEQTMACQWCKLSTSQKGYEVDTEFMQRLLDRLKTEEVVTDEQAHTNGTMTAVAHCVDNQGQTGQEDCAVTITLMPEDDALDLQDQADSVQVHLEVALDHLGPIFKDEVLTEVYSCIQAALTSLGELKQALNLKPETSDRED